MPGFPEFIDFPIDVSLTTYYRSHTFPQSSYLVNTNVNSEESRKKVIAVASVLPIIAEVALFLCRLALYNHALKLHHSFKQQTVDSHSTATVVANSQLQSSTCPAISESDLSSVITQIDRRS